MEIRTYTNRPACVKSVRRDEDGNAGVLAHFQGVIDLANDVDQPHPNPAGAHGPRCMCAKISSAVEPLPLSTLSAVAESRPVRRIVAEALLEALVPHASNDPFAAYRGKARCRAGRKCSREPGASACAPSAAMRS